MDDGFGVNFHKVHEEMTTEFTVTELTPGVQYSFKVSATNYNGEGATSEVQQIKSCIVPYDVRAPTLVATSTTSVELRWSAPEDGGCPIESYSILSDLGVQGQSIDNVLEAVEIENNPNKFSHILTFTSADTGKRMKFKLVAQNEIGSTMSKDYVETMLISRPAAPSNPV
jgi:hypothetical protein